MKISKKLLIFNLILIMLIILSTNIFNYNVYATSINAKAPIKIAVFFDNSNAMYISLLKENLELIQKENKDMVEFTFFDAKDNQALQNESIEKALKDNFDLFIVGLITPKLSEVKNTLSKTIEQNMPLILNPDPSQEIIEFMKPYSRFVVIGADFEQSGVMEGKLIINEWNSNKKNIDKNQDNILQYIMLKGRIGSPLTYLRTKYSILTLNDAGIKTEELASPYCEWLQDCAKNSIEALFLQYGNKIEAIISNNDAMAIGAVEALQKYGYNKGDNSFNIPVIGIDGMPIAKDLIQKGFMTGTVVVEPSDLAKALYSVGMNMAKDKPFLENTNYKFDNTGFTIHLNYKEYTVKETK